MMMAIPIIQMSELLRLLKASLVASAAFFVGHAGQCNQGNAQNRHCADGHGFADDAGDDADEQRQKMPCVGRYALRHGDNEPDKQRQARAQPQQELA